MEKEQPIGLFDSGVGGLTVAGEIMRQLPFEKIIYFGDTAHVPYGSRPVEELRYLADVIVSFLVSKGAKAVVDACNSTSSVAIDFLKGKYSVPIVGVVEPGVDIALERSVNRRIGLIATEATVRSGAHERYARKLDAAVTIHSRACPLFVHLVEAGETGSISVRRAAKRYLEPLLHAGIDTLILGCTHYPFLIPVLKDILGPGVVIVDPAAETVKRLKDDLWKKNLLTSGETIPVHSFYVSGEARSFQAAGEKLLGNPELFQDVRRVELGKETSGFAVSGVDDSHY